MLGNCTAFTESAMSRLIPSLLVAASGLVAMTGCAPTTSTDTGSEVSRAEVGKIIDEREGRAA